MPPGGATAPRVHPAPPNRHASAAPMPLDAPTISAAGRLGCFTSAMYAPKCFSLPPCQHVLGEGDVVRGHHAQVLVAAGEGGHWYAERGGARRRVSPRPPGRAGD